MKTFKSITDVDRLRNDPAYSPLHATIKELVSTIGVTRVSGIICNHCLRKYTTS